MKNNYIKHILLCLALLTGTNALAYDACIDGIYYDFSNGEATVTYQKYESYNYISDYSGNVVIPETVTYEGTTYSVTSIGNYAFYGCSGLNSVTIPNSVTSIGDYAFRSCSGLTSVTIPNSVTSIGDYAFRSCSGLTSITIPNSVTSIGSSAFSGCSGLTSVTIGNSVTSIGRYAFYNCSGLTSVTIPESVTSIGSYAFYGCSGLTSVTIPGSVTSIGSYAFKDCSSLSNVYCHAQEVPQTNSNAFSNSSIGSATLYVPDVAIETYRKTAPWKNFGTIESLNISFADANVKAICIANWDTNGDGELDMNEAAAVTDLKSLFRGNKQITSFDELQYFTGLTSIGYRAFEDCSGLTSITIPNSVTNIDESAFEYCSGLTSVTIPNSVTSIGWYAFERCSGLTSVIIGNGVTYIGSYAFEGCSGLTSVTIPNSVTNIGYYAFRYCSGLTSVTIPNSVTSIGADAFNGTAWYDNQPDGLVYAGKIAYKYKGTMPEGTEIVIKDGTLGIVDAAFRGCSGLTSVTIPNSVTSIGEGAFYGCSGLTSITIPNSVTSIDIEAFKGCKLRNVLIKCATPPSIRSDTFSNQTLYHTTLFVPAGTWDAYAYDNYWYKFINIRETAMAEDEVSEQSAYTLMDAETFAYSVYDPVNDCIGTINSAGSINEDNPNHSWQMMEAGGLHYLYNIGAKKYAKQEGNSLCLCDEPTPIDVADGDNGLILAGETGKQWALVSNERLNASQAAIDQVTGIKAIDHSPLNIDHSIYNMSGQRLSKPQKGLNIVGGRKVLMK